MRSKTSKAVQAFQEANSKANWCLCFVICPKGLADSQRTSLYYLAKQQCSVCQRLRPPPLWNYSILQLKSMFAEFKCEASVLLIESTACDMDLVHQTRWTSCKNANWTSPDIGDSGLSQNCCYIWPAILNLEGCWILFRAQLQFTFHSRLGNLGSLKFRGPIF